MAAEAMRIIVGLGNPGPSYRLNRHNVGFMVLDELATRLDLEFVVSASAWQMARGDGIVLLKPQMYMNRSGEALGAWARETGVRLTGRNPVESDEEEATGGNETKPANDCSGQRPLIVCDDLALPLGAVRLRPRGSSGGQNGLSDIIAHLGGPDFPRLRLGVAPEMSPVPAAEWANYVLSDFTVAEEDKLSGMRDHAVAALEFWLAHGLEATISRFNRRSAPPADCSDS